MIPIDASISMRVGCKINSFLRITGKREDGYHTLRTLFFPLREPFDTLTISVDGPEGSLTFACQPEELGGEDNLVCQAYYRFLKVTGWAPGLKVKLVKGIPMGAGLGGGSADAASLLRFCNNLAATEGRELDWNSLVELAAGIGADVPFFLNAVPSVAHGIGDDLIEVENPFRDRYLVLVCPPIAISTAWAFKEWDKHMENKNFSKSILTIDRGSDRNAPVHGHWLENNFEAVVFPAYPEIAAIKAELIRNGAMAAVMSGSGASVFGVFSCEKDALKASAALTDFGEVYCQVV